MHAADATTFGPLESVSTHWQVDVPLTAADGAYQLLGRAMYEKETDAAAGRDESWSGSSTTLRGCGVREDLPQDVSVSGAQARACGRCEGNGAVTVAAAQLLVPHPRVPDNAPATGRRDQDGVANGTVDPASMPALSGRLRRRGGPV
ncbi:hypothetical protein ACFC4G_32050 [Streptomyces sp. NPDC056002]|uniref:hypothetical protein n=1 Tax=Streptomyces sp. NPDC056002 TaxID=3345675 RepID=UPI0035D9C86B